MTNLRDIEKLYPGKKVILKGGKIFIRDKTSSQRKGTGKPRSSFLNKEKATEMEEKAYKEGKIYIPYEVMSSKNSMVIDYVYKKGQSGKAPILKHSQAYNEYAILSGKYWKKNRKRFLEIINGLPLPYHIGFFFHRATSGRFDYPNMMQGVMDLMVAHGWLEDDNADIIMPIPLGYLVDKEIQGLILSVDGTKKKDL